MKSIKTYLLACAAVFMCQAAYASPNPSCKISIGPEDASFKLGEPIEIAATLENISQDDLNVTNEPASEYKLIMWDEHSQSPPAADELEVSLSKTGVGGTKYALPPGSKKNDTILAASTYDIKRILPGTYYTQAEWVMKDVADKACQYVKSNVISITVKP